MASARRASRSAHAAQAYNGAVRGQLADLQRARMLAAMFDVAAQRGAGNVTVAHVVERSGVSRRTFYELFSDREDCLHAAFEQALTYATERVLPAYEAEDRWREKVRAGLVALLGFLDAEPVIGKLLIVESHAGGQATSKRRGEVIAALTSAVEEGGVEGKASVTPSSLTAEGVVGGVLAVIQSRLQAQGGAGAVGLTNPLMSMIVLPYLGAAAARRELERTVPQSKGSTGEKPLGADPFKDAGMRLTYRTVRVLFAVASHPDASNRQVGEAAGITDQGQISKLLNRLERIGLVRNTGAGAGKGMPNAWSLTEKGQRITDGMNALTGTKSHVEQTQQKT